MRSECVFVFTPSQAHLDDFGRGGLSLTYPKLFKDLLSCFFFFRLPKTNIKTDLPKRKIVFQPCIFRGELLVLGCVYVCFCVLFSKGSNLKVLHRYRNNVDLNAYNRQWKSLVICYGLYLKAIIIVWLGPFSTMWALTIATHGVITPISRATSSQLRIYFSHL